jgi:uncharacterized protein (DUF305 family)
MLRVLLAAAALISAAPVFAQDHSQHGGAPSTLPPICIENASTAHNMAPMGEPGPHPGLMDGMDQMNADMMAGATATDIDVAFVCSMIPHHQGAITMAKAELATGDEAFPRELAEAIIAAQEREIAAMLEWLNAR